MSGQGLIWIAFAEITTFIRIDAMIRLYKRKDTAHTDQNLITTTDLCELVAVSRSKLKNAMSIPELNPPQAKKIGKKYFYNKQEMVAWCKKVDITRARFINYKPQRKNKKPVFSPYQSTPFNAKAKEFLSSKPVVKIQPKPEKKKVKRQTVHLDEINQTEMPCSAMLTNYRNTENYRLCLPGEF